MKRFSVLAATAAIVLLGMASSDAQAFGGRLCNRPGLFERIAERVQERRASRLAGNPGNGPCQPVQATSASTAKSTFTWSSDCQFGSYEGPGSPCWPPATMRPIGRVVLGSPGPACPGGVCPPPR